MRRHVNEDVATHPERDRRQKHQNARNRERNAGGILRMVSENPDFIRVRPNEGNHQRRKERPKVDDEVERLEDSVDESPVAFSKLVTHVRRHAGFNPAGSDRNQPQPDRHASDRILRDRQHQMSKTVDQ